MKKINRFYKLNKANLLIKFAMIKIEAKRLLKKIRRNGKRRYKLSIS